MKCFGVCWVGGGELFESGVSFGIFFFVVECDGGCVVGCRGGCES